MINEKFQQQIIKIPSSTNTIYQQTINIYEQQQQHQHHMILIYIKNHQKNEK